MRHTAGVSERKTWQYFDGLGRLLRTRDRTFASSLHTYVDRVYEICSCTGKTEKISLPYISGDPIYWTETEYDGIGRPTKVIPPDGSPTSNYTEYKYSGVTINNITYPIRAVFDAKGVGKAYVTDAAGQLVEVREDPNYTTLASSTVTDYDQHPGTSYSYKSVLRWDIYTQSYQSKLVYMADHNYSEIYQGVQTRTFQYDSLGRPAEETHPENGTTTYAYNDNGWMLSKTDARGVVTAPLYDALGRPTSIGYSDSTPTATYTYDTGGYGIGRLYETSNANATTTYLYNLRGFVVGIDKTIGTEDFSISYTRNYVGAAKSTMLPNGTTISYTRNRGHKITGVTSDWVDANHPATLATSFVYSGVGALLTSVEYGNGTVSTRSFNTGMQLKTLEYGTLADPDQYLDFEYDYDEGVSNTGQIMKITDHIDTTKTINYTYDDFYRLKTAATQGTHWGLSWTYDRYGNRLAQTKTKGTAPANTLSVSTATNRVNTWTYDGAGNITDDSDYDYTFDANNMIRDVDGGSTADYDYDVNGQRVMKTIGSETIYYVLGVGQYSSVSGWDKVYVHLGRKKLLEYSNNTTHFYGTDHLATPRVQTNVSGTVTEEWSSYPYGEEWEQSGPDTEENRFTGHLKDLETGNHYAGARFLDDQSRWKSVDSVLGDSSNPQHLNRFSYTLSDPVNNVDPDGRFRCPLGQYPGASGGQGCGYFFGEGFVGGRGEGEEEAATGETGFGSGGISAPTPFPCEDGWATPFEARTPLTYGPGAQHTLLAITTAMKQITAIGADGESLGSLWDFVSKVSWANGDVDGYSATARNTIGHSFRIFVDFSAGFKAWVDAGARFKLYGMGDTLTAQYQGNLASQHKYLDSHKLFGGGSPSLQLSYTPDGLYGEIDLDFYRYDPRHLLKGNSDVRKHFGKFLNKFGSPGFYPCR